MFSLGGIFILIKEGFSIKGSMPVLFFSICLIVFLFEEKLNDWVVSLKEKKTKAEYCKFQNEVIFFPKGYCFNQGYLSSRKELSYKLVDEIRINTNPISAKINGNEIVFLLGAEKSECERIARIYNIPIVSPTDNWALICDEFLDTEEEDKFRKMTLESLEKVGIQEKEVKEIRKRISWRMIVNTSLTLEWVYYGQYDLLIQLFPLNKEKYWWTMEIALRNKEK